MRCARAGVGVVVVFPSGLFAFRPHSLFAAWLPKRCLLAPGFTQRYSRKRAGGAVKSCAAAG